MYAFLVLAGWIGGRQLACLAFATWKVVLKSAGFYAARGLLPAMQGPSCGKVGRGVVVC